MITRCPVVSRVTALVLAVVAGVAAGCSDRAPASATGAAVIETVAPEPPTSEATVPPTTVPPTTVAPSTVAPSTVPPTTVAPSTVPPTTVPPTTVPSTTGPSTAGPAVLEIRDIGTSIEGRPITAVRRGEAGGRVVLVIGVIHGDEAAGAQIVDRLGVLDVPAGIDLWLVPSMNPDGQAAVDRHNANQVDLNRNFPYDWGPIGEPGDGQYAGTGPASEPETQAVIALIDDIRPDIVIWYHQDLARIAPGKGRDGAIRARYAELVGLPLVSITGGTYTGVAATWARHEIEPGVAFIVELGPTLSEAEADVYARAVLTVASEAG